MASAAGGTIGLEDSPPFLSLEWWTFLVMGWDLEIGGKE